MSFHVISENEPIQVKNVNILIYGEPGAGKTSLVNTAKKPLTLDFDKGVHRSDFRKDVLEIQDWKQINDDMKGLKELFKKYDTVILDTVDTLLDYLGAWIVEEEPRLARNKLQFYGRLKEEFAKFVGILRTYGKDVIMITHVREKDEGENRIKRPLITGGSYDKVLQLADFVGFLFMYNNQRTLEFNPTDWSIGKNSAALPSKITIPDLYKEGNYFTTIIDGMKRSLNRRSEKQTVSMNMLNERFEHIKTLTTAEELTEYTKSAYMDFETEVLSNPEMIQVWAKIKERATELKYAWEITKKYFYKLPDPPPEPEPEPQPSPKLDKPKEKKEQPKPPKNFDFNQG